ncbi:MAG: endonuclease [Rhodobacteraceae bacterium]|nr:endonuclease [Paracoccaceae bacterium]
MLRKTILIVLFVPVILLFCSFLGALHPVGDSIAVFRVQLALATSFAGIAIWLISMRRSAGMISLMSVVWLASADLVHLPFTPPAGLDYKVYQKNLSFRNPDLKPVELDILQIKPDFVTLQEVTEQHRAILGALSDEYQSMHFCRFARVGGVAVASKWPLVDGSQTCAEADGMAAMQVKTPAGPVWIVSLHLHWPFPHRQPQQIQRLLPRIQALNGDKVIGGDFNMVPWSDLMRRVQSSGRVERIGSALNSFPRFGTWIRLPIDHILIPEGQQGETELRPLLGSDHRGLIARFRL